jgi:hypothetical protein
MDDGNSKQMMNEQGFAMGAMLVTQFAPEEAELYPDLIAAHLIRPDTSTVDHPLGMGLGEIVSAVSPFFFEVGGVVVASLWAIAKTTAEKSVQESIAPRITNWIRRRFAKPAPLTLSDYQVDAIMNALESKVARMKVPPDMKKQVVSAIRRYLDEGRGSRSRDVK